MPPPQESGENQCGLIMEIEEKGEIQGTFNYTGRRVDTICGGALPLSKNGTIAPPIHPTSTPHEPQNLFSRSLFTHAPRKPDERRVLGRWHEDKDNERPMRSISDIDARWQQQQSNIPRSGNLTRKGNSARAFGASGGPGQTKESDAEQTGRTASTDSEARAATRKKHWHLNFHAFEFDARQRPWPPQRPRSPAPPALAIASSSVSAATLLQPLSFLST
ncbi:hypothetical protein BJ912DRAFT_1118859 [Pholiota molesta]|nr:hypothetical protein BJ912DRAFT_1118859 [Pholiota molesta]